MNENAQISEELLLLQLNNGVAALMLRGTGKGFAADSSAALALAATTLEVDRAFVCEDKLAPDGRHYYIRTYHWISDYATNSLLTPPEEVFYENSLPGWYQRLSSDQYVNALTCELPEGTERASLERYGVRSVLAVPIFLHNAYWGFVSFHDCRRNRRFSPALEDAVRTCCLIFASTALRNDAMLRLSGTMAELESVIANYIGVIWSVNKERIITKFDGQYLSVIGVTPAFLEGKKLSLAHGKQRHLDIIERVEAAFGGERQDWVGSIDGRTFRSHVTPVYDDKGVIVSVTGSTYDITDSIEMEDNLRAALEIAEAASQAKNDFFSNMSHEMRTPLNAIIGMTAIGKAADAPERKDYALEKIEDASTYLLGVINDVLDMSKIEAGKLELFETSFALGESLRRLAGVISFKAEEQGLDFKLTIDPRIPEVVIGDEQRFTQMVTNLLSNAIKFTPEGGCVSLSAGRLEAADADASTTVEATSGTSNAQPDDQALVWISVAVRDTGIGITPEQMQRLFVPFEQAERGTSRKYGGTGLGLAICKQIVDLMGGRIKVNSEPEKGSEFVVSIGFRQDAAASQAALSDESALSTNSTLGAGATHFADPAASPTNPEAAPDSDFSGHRILLAEDIEINREIVLALLEPTGLSIDCAENGAVAVRMFTAAPEDYDMIFMDMQMPEMDGLQATQQIRALANQGLQRGATIPIIAMTANVFKEDVERCLDAGMNDFVGKPIDFGRLHGLIAAYL